MSSAAAAYAKAIFGTLILEGLRAGLLVLGVSQLTLGFHAAALLYGCARWGAQRRPRPERAAPLGEVHGLPSP